MSFVTIMCSRTGEFVSTGIEIDADSFRLYPATVSRMKCPVCGSEHAWSKGRAWLTDPSDPLVRHGATEAVHDLLVAQLDAELSAFDFESVLASEDGDAVEPTSSDEDSQLSADAPKV